MNNPLISITIPTYNSEKTLPLCLQSIQNQTYQPIETIIIDSYSQDKTIKIAKTYPTKIIQTKWKRLGARYLGLQKAKGEYILLLDSDQILKTRKVIQHAVNLTQQKNLDLLILEEETYQPQTWLQKLHQADRKLIHQLTQIQKNPVEGVLHARFYKKTILEKAFNNIPEQLIPTINVYDDAIIYYEATKISKKVDILPNALFHIEPKTLTEFWRKNYNYGKNTKKIIKTGYYQQLLNKKIRFRKGALKKENLWLGFQSYLLLTLKALTFKLGYWKE